MLDDLDGQRREVTDYFVQMTFTGRTEVSYNDKRHVSSILNLAKKTFQRLNSSG
jgi:hypothetical protein